MGRKGRRLRKLTHELAQRFPQLEDPEATIADGQVLVDGFPSSNPASLIPVGVPLALREPAVLRGEAKLRHAIEAFEVDITDRVAVDIGAAAGGFTRVLLKPARAGSTPSTPATASCSGRCGKTRVSSTLSERI